MNEHPTYLYHYTSIETLALILKNKTIRLKRLDLVDDPGNLRLKIMEILDAFVLLAVGQTWKKNQFPCGNYTLVKT